MPFIEVHDSAGKPAHLNVRCIETVSDGIEIDGVPSCLIEFASGAEYVPRETTAQVVALIDAAEDRHSDPFRHVPGATSAADLKAMRESVHGTTVAESERRIHAARIYGPDGCGNLSCAIPSHKPYERWTPMHGAHGEPWTPAHDPNPDGTVKRGPLPPPHPPIVVQQPPEAGQGGR